MTKRIFSYIMMVSASALFMISCSEDEDKIEKFTSKVAVTGTSIAADKYAMTLQFSTDNGATWVKYPVVKVGQSYLATVFNQTKEAEVNGNTCFTVDWSGSNPQPVSVDGGVGAFTMTSSNELVATVVNVPFVSTDAAGKYEVVTDDWEDFAPGDVLTVESIDATHVRIVEYPGTSTNHKPLVITVPDPTLGGTAVVSSQSNGAYGSTQLTTAGSGEVNCHGDIKLTLNFTYTGGSSAGNVLELKKK
jgi:hypothetical protein